MSVYRLFYFTLLTLFIDVSLAFDNNAATTPPMGFLTWNRFRCITDCDKYPDDCISERLIMLTAKAMVREGFRDSGYTYVIIDDCWPEFNRNKDGKIVGDRKRFPNGMKFIGDELKKNGLKFGLYADIGTKSCKGYPGIAGYEEKDLETYIKEYGVEYIKVDGCNLDIKLIPDAFINISNILLEKYKGVVYGCAWPDVNQLAGLPSDFVQISKYCNIWRSYDSIADSAMALWHIIDYYENMSDPYKVNRKGAWNDADMLIIGGFGVSYDLQRVQMALWCIMPSPLLISADLTTITIEAKTILLNPLAISINQDAKGLPGVFLGKDKDLQLSLWCRPLSDGLAFAIISRREDYPVNIRFYLKNVGIESTTNVIITDVFKNVSRTGTNFINLRIPPQGVKFMFVKPGIKEKPFGKPCQAYKLEWA